MNRSWPFVADDRVVVLEGDYRLPLIAGLEAAANRIDLIGHSTGVVDAEVSPDGRFVATAGDDWHAILWNADTGDRRARFVGHMRSVRQVMFSSDGAFVATLGEDDTLRVWDRPSGTQFLRIRVAVNRLLNFEASTIMLAAPGKRLIRIECEPCQPMVQLKKIARDRLARLNAPAGVSPAGVRPLRNPSQR